MAFVSVVTALAVSSAHAIIGDLDKSGRVDGRDLSLLGRNFGLATNAPGVLAAADLNHDGIINSNDFSLLDANFGKTENGGAAAWVSDDHGVYKLNIDSGALKASVTGFPETPLLQDVNPDTGEAWVLAGTSVVYVISPFVPDAYNVSTMTGWHRTYYVPGVRMVRLAPGTNAVVGFAYSVHYWHNFSADYDPTADVARTHCKEFTGFGYVQQVALHGGDWLWVFSIEGNAVFRRILLSTPSGFDVATPNMYLGSYQVAGTLHVQMDMNNVGDALVVYVYSDGSFDPMHHIGRISAQSMGMVARRDEAQMIDALVPNPDDGSVWYMFGLSKTNVLVASANLDDVLVNRRLTNEVRVRAVDTGRKRMWCTTPDATFNGYHNGLMALNYLGMPDLVVTSTWFHSVNAIKLFVPPVFAGYPVAVANAVQVQGRAPLTVAFTATNSYDPDGRIVQYQWDFDGDNLIDLYSDTPWASNTYMTPGRYSIMLRVVDDDGLSSYDSHLSVGVGPMVLTALATPVSGAAPLSVVFDATVVDGTGNGVMENYQWDFDGDGLFDYASLTTPATTHVYQRGGTYTARLRVLSKAGEMAEATVLVTVRSVPPDCTLLINGSAGSINIAAPTNMTLTVWLSDADGSVTLLEMDLDGDGAFDYRELLPLGETEKNVPVFVSRVGVTVFRAMVTDNDGATSAVRSTSVRLVPAGYNLVASPEMIAALGSVVLSSLPAIVAVAPGVTTCTVARFDLSSGSNVAWTTVVATSTLAQVTGLTVPGVYEAGFDVLTCKAYFSVMPAGSAIARLEAVPEAGMAPLAVQFDASGSTSGAAIVQYAWDFDGPAVDDGAEQAEGPLFGTATRVTSPVYQGTYAWKLDGGIGCLSTYVLTLPDDCVLAIAAYMRGTNLLSYGHLAVTVYYERADGGMGETAVPMSLYTNWTRNACSVTLPGARPGGRFFVTMRAPLGTVSYLDNILIGRHADGFAADTNTVVSMAQHVYKDAGVHYPTVRITDAAGRRNYAQVQVVAQTSLGLTIIAPTNGSVCGRQVQFTAACAFAADVTRYAWDFDADGAIDRLMPSLATESHTYPADGAYTAWLIAWRADGRTETAMVSFAVAEDTVPVILSFKASPSHGMLMLMPQFTAAVDYRDSDVAYNVWQLDDLPPETNTMFSIVQYIETKGVHTQRFTTISLGGQQASATALVRGVPWANGVLLTPFAKPAIASKGVPVVLDATVQIGAYAAPAMFGWDFENDGVVDWTSAVSPRVEHTYLAAGVVTARVEVVSTSGVCDTMPLVLAVNAGAATGSFVTTASLYNVPTNYVQVGMDDRVRGLVTGCSEYVSGMVRQDNDGSVWAWVHTSYDERYVRHFDRDIGHMGVFGDTGTYSIMCMPAPAAGTNEGAACVAYVHGQGRYALLRLDAQCRTRLATLLDAGTVYSMSRLVCADDDAVYLANDWQLTCFDARNQRTATIGFKDPLTDLRWNAAGTTIWAFVGGRTVHVLTPDLAVVAVLTNMPYTLGIDVNPVDGTVVLMDNLLNRYTARGTLLCRVPAQQYGGVSIVAIDVADGGVIYMPSAYPDRLMKCSAAGVHLIELTNIITTPIAYLTSGASYFGVTNRPAIAAQYSLSGTSLPVRASFSVAATSPAGICLYEWDVDGNAIMDYSSPSNGACVHTYTAPGTYYPLCRVTDNRGISIADTRLEPIRIGRLSVELFATPSTNLAAPTNILFTVKATCSRISQLRFLVDGEEVYTGNSDVGMHQFTHGFLLAGDYPVRVEVTDTLGETAAAEMLVAIPHHPPIALISMTTNMPFAPQQVVFSARDSADSDGSIEHLQWDLDGNGVFERAARDVTETMAVTYHVPGTNTVRLRVTDNAGLVTETNAVAIVDPAPPVAVLTGAPLRGIAPFPVQFSYAGSSRSGSIVRYLLDADGDGTNEVNMPTASPYLHMVSNDPGTHAAVLSVVDTFGATGTTWCTVTVLTAGTPLASAHATPAAGAPPLDVTLVGACSNLPVSLYEWDCDSDGVFEWQSAVTGIATYTYMSKGTYRPQLRITATNGMQDVARIMVAVGVPPVAEPRITPLRGTVPQTVRLVADGYDLDGTVLYYYWDLLGSGDWRAYDAINDEPSTMVYSEPGTNYPRLMAVDDSGLSDTGTVMLVMTTPGMPTVEAYAQPASALTGQTIRFFAYASDRDGAIAQVRWLFGDAQQAVVTTNGASSHAYAVTGVFTAACIATDDRNNSATATVMVCIHPAGWPEARASVTPAAGLAPLACVYTLAGTPGYAPIVRYALDVDGDGSNDYSVTTPGAVAHTFHAAGAWRSMLTATDADGHYAVQRLDVAAGGTMSVIFDREWFDPTMGDMMGVSVVMPVTAVTTVQVADRDGGIVRTLADTIVLTAGITRLAWDGRDSGGAIMPHGVYYVIAQYQHGGNTIVYDLSHETPPVSSPLIDQSTVYEKSFSIFRDNPLLIGYMLNMRSEFSLYMSRNVQDGNYVTYLTNRVKTIYHREPMPAGKATARWDCTDDNGSIAVDPYSNDDYIFCIWNWVLATNSVVIKSRPRVTDITLSGEPNYFSPGPNPYRPEITNHLAIAYVLSKPATNVVVAIAQIKGRHVASMSFTNMSAGAQACHWDGRADNGFYVMPGDYRVGVQATDSHGTTSEVIYDLFKVFY